MARGWVGRGWRRRLQGRLRLRVDWQREVVNIQKHVQFWYSEILKMPSSADASARTATSTNTMAVKRIVHTKEKEIGRAHV